MFGDDEFHVRHMFQKLNENDIFPPVASYDDILPRQNLGYVTPPNLPSPQVRVKVCIFASSRVTWKVPRDGVYNKVPWVLRAPGIHGNGLIYKTAWNFFTATKRPGSTFYMKVKRASE